MTKASSAIRACLGGHEPSDEQWAAITHDPVALAIIAGAGSGKTAIMAARMVWMVESNLYRPSQILGLTFTNKAARELEERIVAAFDKIDPAPVDAPVVSTYNSFGDRLVREHGVRIGLDPEVGLVSQAQSWQLLLEAFDNLPPFDAIDSRSMPSVIRAALGLADACGNHMVQPERVIEEDQRIIEDPRRFDDEFVMTSRKRIELCGVVRAYIDTKRRAGRIDFNDQVSEAVTILERYPEVGASLRDRFPALLLDEYQDTNIAQRRLLQLMAPMGYNVTAVGDARQNIFQWRGSTLFNLIDFPTKHFLREGGQAHDYLSLSRNYRSGSRILAVANNIIEPVPAERRPGKPLVAESSNGNGVVVTKLASDQYSEAGFIAGEINSWRGESCHKGRAPLNWNDFAILVRRRAHIGPIYQTLREHDIPVEVVGLAGLLQVPEVLDVIAWLRILGDPGPNSNRWLARILLGPRFRIHYRDLALLARWAVEHNIDLSKDKRQHVGEGGGVVADETELEPDEVAFSLTEALDHLDDVPELPFEARTRLDLARADVVDLRSSLSDSLLEVVQTVIASSGIIENLDSAPRDEIASSKANITNFLGVVAGFAPISGAPSINGFLAYLDAAEDIEETLEIATPASGDSVKLMTVHQAKGLEFEVVFIPCVAAGTNAKGEYVHSFMPDTRISNPMTAFSQLPPTVREDAVHLPDPWTIARNGSIVAKKKITFRNELILRAIEDERRLFYVALTRAKQRLYVTAAWWYERQASLRGPSLFFNEIVAAPDVERLPDDECPESNPLHEILRARAVWPPAAPTILPDILFPEGYPQVVESLVEGNLDPQDLLRRLDPDDRQVCERIIEAHRTTLAALGRSGARDTAWGAQRQSISATRAVTVRAGFSRSLPERPTSARRIGTEIHRWIEEQARGFTGIADEEALDAPTEHVEVSRIEQLRARYNEMGYPDRRLANLDSGEPMAEVPFVLKLGDVLVKGRIDAVYRGEDGSLEIVDFKTGLQFETPDIDQLIVYAGALAELGLDTSSPITLTYCYLESGERVSRQISADDARNALKTLEGRLS